MCVGMQHEDLFNDVTPEHPSEVVVSCPVVSRDVYWSKLNMDETKQLSYRQGTSFIYHLSSYSRSTKFACHSDHLHSIVYIHPKGEWLLL